MINHLVRLRPTEAKVKDVIQGDYVHLEWAGLSLCGPHFGVLGIFTYVNLWALIKTTSNCIIHMLTRTCFDVQEMFLLELTLAVYSERHHNGAYLMPH